MTLEELLPRFDAVHRSSRGFVARCPAHADRHPSLAVSEGERGILLKCWTGCSIQEVAAALGLCVRDLFFDTDLDPRARMEAQEHRAQQRKNQAQVDDTMGYTIDALREANYFVRSRQGLDISTWKDSTLNEELSTLAAAYALLWSEELAQWT